MGSNFCPQGSMRIRIQLGQLVKLKIIYFERMREFIKKKFLLHAMHNQKKILIFNQQFGQFVNFEFLRFFLVKQKNINAKPKIQHDKSVR